MKKIILAVAALGLVCTGSAFAGDKVTPNIDKGTKSATLYGSYDNNDALDYQLTLAGTYGYYFWDNVEIAGVLGWQSNDLADTVEIGLVGTYNFNTGSAWIPFIKAGVLYAGVEIDDDVYNDVDDADADAVIGRLGAGVKYFFRDDVALSLAVNYDIASEDLYFDDDGNLDDYNITALIGIEFYFD